MRNCRKKDIQFNEYKIDYFFYFDLLSRTHLFLPSIYGRRPCYLVFFLLLLEICLSIFASAIFYFFMSSFSMCASLRTKKNYGACY